MRNPFVDEYGLSGFGFFCSFVAALGLITAVIVGLAFYSAGREAAIYNNINGTTWTASDFFWAGRQINAGTGTVNVH